MPVRYCPDSGSTQTRLLSEVRKTVDATPFGRVVVVTASGALRKQLVGVLAAGRPALGVEVVALWRFARDILVRCGEREPQEGPELDLLALEHDPLGPRAAADRVGARVLAGGAEQHNESARSACLPPSGFGAALNDLMSAGLCAGNAKKFGAALQRVPADVWPLGSRFTRSLERVLQQSALGARAQDEVLRRAAALVRTHPDALPPKCPPRSVHVVGFANATGLAVDLLRALIERGATLWLECPVANASLALPVVEAQRHAAAFASQLNCTDAPDDDGAAAGAPAVAVAAVGDALPRIDAFMAPQFGAEADEVALRVRTLLTNDSAASRLAPERIAIVMTDYDARASEVARALEALGIPFHGQAPRGCQTAEDRACIAAATLLEQGPTEHPVLRLGSATLSQNLLASMTKDATQTREAWCAWMRAALAEWQSAAASASDPTSVDAHQRASSRDATRRMQAAVQALETLPAALVCSTLTWRSWSAQALRWQVVGTIGTRGHGVQLLSPARARGLHFQHLFLMGVDAQQWPHRRQPDAVFPDAARAAAEAAGFRALAAPDPVQEDAHLFAQLVQAAPHCTLSWRCTDDEGRERSAALWALQLLRSTGIDKPQRLRLVVQPRLEQALMQHGALPVRAAVQLAGLRGDEALHQRLLAQDLGLGEVAACRARLRSAFDDPCVVPSPWHGAGLDVSSREGAVCSGENAAGASEIVAWSPTRLEGLAGCGWKVFLQRCVGVAPAPDPLDAAASLLPMHLGSLVHKALELVLEKFKGKAPPLASESDWRGEVHEAIKFVASEKRTGPQLWTQPGTFREGVEAQVRESVRCALELLRTKGVTRVTETETKQEVTVQGLRIKFRADALVDEKDGQPLFIDWKTSKNELKLGTKTVHLARGTALQAAIYATTKVDEKHAGGAYAYVNARAKFDEGERFQRPKEPDANAVLKSTLGVLQGVMGEKLAPPRVAQGNGNEGDACRYCEFRRCCVIGDSRQSWRLQDAAEESTELQPTAFGQWWRMSGTSKDASAGRDGGDE